ncbi:hypothetical protein [Falsiroseomonas oryziterrae]|uniref:hypothetical protein n=1 Tax=Falsiroseomonas oryziterrae TaxID=2911368 RepID=UPI001F4456A2|nr:hypothetical protein [Roseomonas sp. NPKOSM-4]
MDRTAPCRRRLAALAVILPGLAGCETAREIDAAMRRVDVLDRVFQPRRPPPPAVVVAGPAVVAPPVWDGQPKEPEPATVPAVDVVAPVEEAPPATVEEATAPSVVAQPLPPPAAPVDPALRRAALIRQYPWLTRFWGELTPDQRGRVARRLPGDAASAWDRMGLAERVRLVFGERS